jgi:RimJ/RimL family protein N-acetyltransferase
MIVANGCALEHILAVARNIAPEELQVYYEMTGQVFEPDDIAARVWLSGGRNWVFWETVERVPLAVGGYHEMRPGAWSSWFMPTPLAWSRDYAQELTERVAQTLRNMLDSPDVRRLETVTLASRSRARKWYERIGLSYESTARRASASGQDLVTYVATRCE